MLSRGELSALIGEIPGLLSPSPWRTLTSPLNSNHRFHGRAEFMRTYSFDLNIVLLRYSFSLYYPELKFSV